MTLTEFQILQRELLDEVRDSLPLDKLPRTLIPNAHLGWLPPKMHYGFDTTAAVVYEYAKEHNLSFYYPKEEPSESLPSAAASGDGDSDGSNHNLGGEPSYESTGGGVGAYSVSRTFYAVMKAVAEELQIDGIETDDTKLVLCLNSASDLSSGGNRYVVSFYTNHDLIPGKVDALPRAEEIEKMRDILGSTLPTGWYLSASRWRWEW
ncbi:uncharacterized protein B0H18DRAFT_1034482 [Fomitopsis serialis]|uniref:uncharacterized protein n=1 Tax=Fomitopsis serialis TaxID=139415 RepID=UPI0020079A94|nr:uncharacterized protein B0H18DRAFT_1034482 [Neoantrodia serialis]KAH9917520.1 hypothetical protein B0H18DRAFT_1034482 [Neoantrodia serialis]